MLKEAYFEANALYPKTNKFGGVSSLKVYQGLPRNAGLPFLVRKYFSSFQLYEMKEELKFAMLCYGSSKPVRKPLKEEDSESEASGR